MEASSTTTRSASRGWSRSKAASPPGRSSSSRCTVAAGCPVSSASRFAARPVGAASTTLALLAAARSTIERTVKLLPQPGPPVSTATLLGQRQPHRLLPAPAPARRRCGRAARPGALSQSTAGEAAAAGRARRASSRSSWPASDDLGAVERHQVDRLDRAAPASAPGSGSRTTPSSATSSSRHGRTSAGVARSRIFAASVDQLRLGQEAVAVVGGLRQGVLQAGLDPLRGCRAGCRPPGRSGRRSGTRSPRRRRPAGTARCARRRWRRRRTVL